MGSEISYKNVVFWSWNGKMEDSEIYFQLNEFKNAGIKGFFMHARAGIEIDYLGELWWNAIKVSVEYAEKLGLDAYIYDEQGWPSGFAGGIVNGLGSDYQIKHLKICEKIGPNDVVIAKYRKIGDGYEVTDYEADLYACYQIDSHYVDLLNPNVIKEFIKSTHEEYKKRFSNQFGKTIKGIFTDEPQMAADCYSPYLHDVYYKLTGNELINDLWKKTDKSNVGKKFCHDYYKAVALQFCESFTKQLYYWCEENNLLFTGHFPLEDGLIGQTRLTGGVMHNYPFMQMPGIDYLGRRLNPILTSKQIGSIKNQLNIPRVISETFGCSGWNTSFREFLWLWGQQVSLGINLACLHLSAFTIKGDRKRDYPAFFSYQEPWWEAMSYLSAIMENMNRISSVGTEENNVLVISALSSVWGTICNEAEQRNISNQYKNLLDNLVDNQISFDIGDELFLKDNAKIEGNKIRVGRCLYDTIIVPDVLSVEHNTMLLLEEFMKKNGEVIFVNNYPQFVEFKYDFETPEIKDYIKSKPLGNLIMNRMDLFTKYFEYKRKKRAVVFLSLTDNKLARNLIVNLREDGKDTYVTVFNCSTENNKKVLIHFEDECIINKISLSDLSEEYIGGNNATVILEAMSFNVFKISKQQQKENIISFDNISKLKDLKAKRLDDNTLTIDRASYSINDMPYSADMPVIKLQDEIYKEVTSFKKSSVVKVRYKFDAVKTVNFKIGIESENVNKVLFNGKEIIRTNEWYIDKAIHLYTVFIKGDTDGDGDITLSDLANLKLKLLNSGSLSGIYETAGDINSDTKISISDLISVKKNLLGLFEINS